jgi:hypothetical protein
MIIAVTESDLLEQRRGVLLLHRARAAAQPRDEQQTLVRRQIGYHRVDLGVWIATHNSGCFVCVCVADRQTWLQTPICRCARVFSFTMSIPRINAVPESEESMK